MGEGIKLTCEEVSRILSAGEDEQLPATERARLRLHLVICSGCRNLEAQLGVLRRAMQRLSRGEPPKE